MNQSKSRTLKNTTVGPTKQYGSVYRTESDQKSVILSKLQAEAGALKQNEKDFHNLKQQYSELDRKYKAQLQEKSLMESDFKNRHDGALRYIGQLKNQSDAIKSQLRDKRLEIQDLSTDAEALKNSLDQRNIEIQKLRVEINALLCDSSELQNERAAFVGQAQILRKNNAALSGQCFNLQKQNQIYLKRLGDLQNYSQQLQAEGNILKDKIKDYQDTNNDIDNQIQQTSFDISQMENIIYQCQQNCTELQMLNATIKTNAEQFRSEGIHNQKASQTQAMKNNELNKKIKQSQHVLKIRSGQIKDGHTEIQEIRTENQNLQRMNSELEQDFQACKKHLQLLGLLNNQLVNCLENYSEEDRKVSEIINRGHRVQYMRGRIQETNSFGKYTGKQSARTDVSFTNSRRSRFQY